ncbi:MAG TPA: hypothetical protein P5121_33770, partial [Caldilineaceae bacterium]|nr:hypothetical protein [Caldilineaceae bacterium]
RAPADERTVGGALDRQPRAAAFLRHLLATGKEALGLRALLPGGRVPIAQDAGVTLQREDGVRVGCGERAQPQARGLQRWGW